MPEKIKKLPIIGKCGGCFFQRLESAKAWGGAASPKTLLSFAKEKARWDNG
jgi:hypothetical protein